MSKVIGIDLGTTNSVVAVREGSETKIVVNEEGGRTTPSVVAWTDKGDVLVGAIARRQAITNPDRTVFSVKRFMGMKHEDAKGEADRVPYDVVAASNGDAHIKVGGDSFAPPEISAKVLAKLKKSAEAHLGEEVTKAVITVPAYFDDAQRQATKDAGRIAGLEVLRIINEPTAAALAYGLDKKKDETIVVYDFGGGTFDVSILEVGDGVIEVVATAGDTHLGGDDFDAAIIDWLKSEYKKANGVELSADNTVKQRLKEAAEKSKIELSSAFESEVNLPFLTADESGPKHLQVTLTRAKLQSLTSKLVERSFAAVDRCLGDAKKKVSDIDEVILVGGSTRMPLIQEKVETFFKKAPNRGVNPDEVVAAGAAIQGAILAGDTKDVVLLDVTPLSLGIETMGGVSTVLIPRNTTIPVKKSEIFSTAADGQTSVDVHVVQGERQMVGDNATLGRFKLDGIPPAARGTPKIEVSFDIDANGILHVSAKDQATGREQSVRIESSSGLSEDEIKRMVEDAERHKSDDEARKAKIETRNELDQLIYQSERTMNDAKDKLAIDVGQRVSAALVEARKVLATDDLSGLDAAKSELEQAAHEMAKSLYQDQSAEPSSGDTAQDNDNVVDAEWREAS